MPGSLGSGTPSPFRDESWAPDLEPPMRHAYPDSYSYNLLGVDVQSTAGLTLAGSSAPLLAAGA